ncbi:MAG: TatD family hydrolase [Candidatus Thermoplasmatota archaeon]|nr:TatD family hydrolase [Candidatus Thermoplasmatota archaeon]
MRNGRPAELDSIFDNHFHLREDGLFLEAVMQFEREGGTCINLTNLPDYSLPADGYYGTLYGRTARIAAAVRRETSVKVVLTLGPYPLDYFFFSQAGRNPLEEMISGVSMAGGYVSRAEAGAIGEVGRPHFAVDEHVRDASNMVISEAMKTAADLGCPVILHTEDLDCGSLKSIEAMATASGIDPGMVVKHHAEPELLSCETAVARSVLATRPNARLAVESGKEFLLETDYVDDPQKPGKVISPSSVPRRARYLVQEFPESVELLRKSFIEIPGRLYGTENIL